MDNNISFGKFSDFDAGAYSSDKEERGGVAVVMQQSDTVADDLDKTFLELRSAYKELQGGYLDAISRLVIIAEYKDVNAGAHIARMSRYSALLGEKLGLHPGEVKNLLYAAPMHDVGNIGVSDEILLKPGKLTEEEFEIMKTHTTIGAKILARSKSEILRLAQRIAITHHEKWNGQGHPNKLSGERIPIEGRIVALADTFDALTSQRPYKEPYPVDVACDIIKSARGQHFDPVVADAFLGNVDEFIQIKEEVAKDRNVNHHAFAVSDGIRSYNRC